MMLATVSHDLKNPLFAMTTFLENIKSKIDKNKNQEIQKDL